MGRLFDQIQEVLGKILLLDMPGLIEVLKQPEIMTAAFITLTLVVFAETGLLVGFFLPGDSLLVTVGIVAWGAGWPIHWLIALLTAAAIVGNSTGYWIGAFGGPRLFTKRKSFFFRQDYLVAAHNFYERHGVKTIILAQFVPIIRTFAPVVAGIGRMRYRRFLTFSVIGAIAWVPSMLLLGYALTPFLDQPLKRVFGDDFETARHIEKVIILVVLVSVGPALYAGARKWLAKRRAARVGIPEEVNSAA